MVVGYAEINLENIAALSKGGKYNMAPFSIAWLRVYGPWR
jgi:hypothetical protein